MTLNLSFGKCDTLFSWVAPTPSNVSAICGVQSVTSPISPPSIFELGTTTVQYTATSNTGNTGTCAFTVTVQQNNPPQFTNCSPNITLNIANGCDTIYNFAQPALVGICNLTGLSIVKPAMNLFPIGNTTVTYTATGANGVATCSFVVKVKENVFPSVICPASDTIFAPSGATSTSVSGLIASASDNCGAVALSYTVNGGSSSNGANASGTFPLGVTPVVFTATDASGNASTCSFGITVLNIPDTVLLSVEDVIIGCKDTTVVVFVNLEDFDAVQNMQFSINFDEAFLEYQSTIISSDLGAGFTMNESAAASGVLIFTGGNSAGLIDSLPNNLLLQLTFKVLQHSGSTTVSLPNLTSPGAGQVYFQYSANSSDVLPYILTNGTITIEDLVPPTITCPTDTLFISNLIQGQSCGILANWGAPTVSDNCSDIVSVVPSHALGSFFALGTTMVTYTATDDAGLSSTCSLNVIVQDTVAPIFSTCPADITVFASATTCTANATWNFPLLNDISENCGIASIESDSTFATTFELGTNTITYTATDFSGNTGTCTFTVTVLDNIAPVFSSACPSGAEVNVTTCTAIYGFVLPEATDNCEVDVYSVPASGSAFPNGMHTITVYAEDASNNIDSCKFTLVVNAVAGNPQLENCPSENILYQVQDECFYIINWEEPKPVGFCGQNVTIVTTLTDVNGVISTVEIGDTVYIGSYTVNFTATDETGTTATCSIVLTVNDSQPPTISCPTETIQIDVAGNILNNSNNFITSASLSPACAGVLLNFAGPTATDNCSLTTVIQNSGLTSGAVFPVGNTTMSFTATDAATNSNSCQFTVSVVGFDSNTPIVASSNPVCPGGTLTLAVPSIQGAVYAWSGPDGVVLPNASSVVVLNFTDKDAGAYNLTVTIPNGNCTFIFDAVTISIVSPVAANDDVYSVFVGGTIDSMHILENDDFTAGDVTYTLINTVAGVNDLGNGVLSYTGNAAEGQLQLMYAICSVTCPDLCNTAIVRISIKNTDCVFIPNLITPNADDLNDEFIIPCLEFDDYPNNNISIYNQWGDIVYEASPYICFPKTLAWKGTLNNEDGKPLPDGVYYYIFKASPTASGKKGFIQIMR